MGARISTSNTTEMDFNGGLKLPLKSNDGSSKIAVYLGDVLSWEVTTMVLNRRENTSFLKKIQF